MVYISSMFQLGDPKRIPTDFIDIRTTDKMATLKNPLFEEKFLHK